MCEGVWMLVCNGSDSEWWACNTVHVAGCIITVHAYPLSACVLHKKTMSCFDAVVSNEAQHCISIMERARGQRLPTPLTIHLYAN